MLAFKENKGVVQSFCLKPRVAGQRPPVCFNPQGGKIKVGGRWTGEMPPIQLKPGGAELEHLRVAERW